MKATTVIFHWLPRILCILAILFISLFALDSFAPGLTLGQQLGAFAMHLIPTFVLMMFLLIAWKWELAGGTIFILTGVGMSPLIFIHNYTVNHSVLISLSLIAVITFPFVVAGILFIVSHYLKKKDVAGSQKII